MLDFIHDSGSRKLVAIAICVLVGIRKTVTDLILLGEIKDERSLAAEGFVHSDSYPENARSSEKSDLTVRSLRKASLPYLDYY